MSLYLGTVDLSHLNRIFSHTEATGEGILIDYTKGKWFLDIIFDEPERLPIHFTHESFAEVIKEASTYVNGVKK